MSNVAPAAGAPSSAPANSSPAPSAEPKAVSTEPSESEGSEPKKEGSEPKVSSEKKSSEPKKESAAEKEEKKEIERRKYKLKVNNKEVEKEYSDEEVSRRLQMIEAADEKFQKASETEKQLRNFVQALKENPLDVLEQLGLGDQLDGLAEKRLTSKVQKELMSPEERELAELRAFKEKAEKSRLEAEERSKKEASSKELEEHRRRYSEQYDRSISEALVKSDLPKTPYTIKRVAELMSNAISKGYDLDPQTAVEMVRDGYLTDIQSMFGNLNAEQILKVLGDDMARKIRRYDVDRLKAKRQSAQPADQVEKIMSDQSSSSSRQPQTKLRADEWREMIRKKAGL